MNIKKIVIILVIIIAVVVVVGIVKLPEESNNEPISVVPSNVNLATENLYKVKLDSRSEAFVFKDPSDHLLSDYIISTLGLPVSTTKISLIAYEPTKTPDPYGKDKFNSEYFISINANVDTQKLYKTSDLTITVAGVDQKFWPFIKNPSYCEIDSDCSVGRNFCSYGSYNNFRILNLSPWGCESTRYSQEDVGQLWSKCDASKQHPEVEYSSSK